ncbi:MULTISPECIES: polysaccharide biosynthesis/export family protein [unclassified Leptolyngbya]|uniref:polysaccharide biosynthesis/export family protein n=1 Tax=unclassified Leptolyngbya TaxID=2650499 RepID=UPI0016891DEF|nr:MULTISPECIES: polysaccharide biosynthesis/export family protein [unclassified Leptolyngbya]MBD1913274.1 polysaccharide export protein [Leptolyngbya sp. FACHB-8]MBD2153364.1 polysaccharide export protein [Leptolyngbya sp. FACHB-16]
MAQTTWLWRFSSSLLAPSLVSLMLAVPALAQTAPESPSITQTIQGTRSGGQVVAPNYILGPGDEIGITVYGYDEMTVQKVVLSDGTILLPLLNSVQVAGMTPDQLALQLERDLNNYLVEPDVAVTLVTLRPVEVNVTGEVQRPGPVRLRGLINTQGGNQAEEVTPSLSTALVRAGGITRYADLRGIELRRFDNSGSSEPTVINLWDAISSGTLAPDLILQDGDSIYVPRLASGEVDQRLISRSSLAPETVRVRVVGEVVNPGEVAVPPNSSVSSAVAIAGGPTTDAELDDVVFVRMNEQGQVERHDMDLRNLMDDFQVQEGDVVIVPKDENLNFLDVALRALTPFGRAVDIIDSIFGN